MTGATAGAVLVRGKFTGCGFVIGPRLALTANHLVRGTGSATIELESVTFVIDACIYTVNAVQSDPVLDVAVLTLNERANVWLAAGHARKGMSWTVRTQPKANDPQLTGVITTLRRQYTNSGGKDTVGQQLQVTENLDDYRGYSGSPVESPGGVVVGVLVEQIGSRLPKTATAKTPAAPVLYATPIEDVIERFGLHETITRAFPADLGVYLDAVIRHHGVDPWTRVASGENVALKDAWRQLSARFEDASGHSPAQGPETADALVDRCDRLVVLGGPGSGKTWFARHTAVRAAEEARRRMADGESVEEVEIPLFVRCSDVVSSRASTWEGTVDAALVDVVYLFPPGQASGSVRRWLIEEPGRYLVIVDGLDEAEGLPVTDYLRRLVAIMGRDLRIVLASRDSAWRNQLDLRPNAIDQAIQDQPSVDAEAGGKWLRGVADLQPLVYPDDIEAIAQRIVPDAGRRRMLLERLASISELADASQNPLICIMLCLLANSERALPDDLCDIYDRVINRLLRGTWRGREPRDRLVELAREALRSLAWSGCAADPGTGLGCWPDAVQSTDESRLSDQVLEIVSHVALETEPDPDLAIVRRRFIHRSIREHLVALHVASLTVEESAESLRPHLWFDSDWTNVVPTVLALHPQRIDLLRSLLDVPSEYRATTSDLRDHDGFGELCGHLTRVADVTSPADWTGSDEWSDDLALLINDVARGSRAAARGWWRAAHELRASSEATPSTAADLEGILRRHATRRDAESYLAMNGTAVRSDLIDAIANQVGSSWSSHLASEAAIALQVLGAPDEARAGAISKLLERLRATPADEKNFYHARPLLVAISSLGTDQHRAEALDLMLQRVDDVTGSYDLDHRIEMTEQFLPTDQESAGHVLREVIDNSLHDGPWGHSARAARRLVVELSNRAGADDREASADAVIARLNMAGPGELTAWTRLLRNWDLTANQRDQATATLLALLEDWPDGAIGNLAVALQDLAPTDPDDRDVILQNLIGRLPDAEEPADPVQTAFVLNVLEWACGFEPVGAHRQRIVQEMLRVARTLPSWGDLEQIKSITGALKLEEPERAALINSLTIGLATWTPFDCVTVATLLRTLSPDGEATTLAVRTLSQRLFTGEVGEFWNTDLLYSIDNLQPTPSDLAEVAARVEAWARNAPISEIARWGWGVHLSKLSDNQLTAILGPLLPRFATDLRDQEAWDRALQFLAQLPTGIAQSRQVIDVLIAALSTAPTLVLDKVTEGIRRSQPEPGTERRAVDHLLKRIAVTPDAYGTTIIAQALSGFTLSADEQDTVRKQMMNHAANLGMDDIGLLKRFAPTIDDLDTLLAHREATPHNWVRDLAETVRHNATPTHWVSFLPRWAKYSRAPMRQADVRHLW